jgi:hypothetical protein
MLIAIVMAFSSVSARHATLKDRSLIPPHAAAQKRVPADFAYHKYLVASLSDDLVEMVDVSWHTWVSD